MSSDSAAVPRALSVSASDCWGLLREVTNVSLHLMWLRKTAITQILHLAVTASCLLCEAKCHWWRGRAIHFRDVWAFVLRAWACARGNSGSLNCNRD